MSKSTFFLILLFVVGLLLSACDSSGVSSTPGTATRTVAALQTAVTRPPTRTATPAGRETAVATRAATERPLATTEPSSTPLPVVPTLPLDELGEGALIAVSMNGRVGVLLDEVPLAMRGLVASWLREQPDDYWLALAERQITLTKYRLNFRNYEYPGRGQLPLPPVALWQIELGGEPVRETVQDHDLVLRAYSFSSTLLTDVASPGEAEPALAEIGGVWEEPFILPLDPDLLYQRTSNACLNEAGFPPNSYDSENARIFYDYNCTADSAGQLGCHRSRVPSFSCLEGVDGAIGRLETAMRFERLAWDDALADAVRVGDVTHLDAPDLDVVAEDLLVNRVIYRYFEPDACALGENAIGDYGWRRLLQFDATLHNIGGVALHIGPVIAEDPTTNVFDYNACHDHFHFSNYGDFIFNSDGAANGSKQAFCVESTDRFSNNEASPLTHPYSCRLQGIQAGWVDEYGAGLDVQWIDITDVAFAGATAVAELGFNANTDGFLCEGQPVLDEAGNRVYEPTDFVTADGRPISRPLCTFVESWQVNNSGSEMIDMAAVGSFVTEACVENSVGPLRNCGFAPQPAADDVPLLCQPGETVQLTAVAPAEMPAVLRVCETSAVLGTGVACVLEDAIANQVVGDEATAVAFTCPLIRDYMPDADDEDAPEVMGGYSLYVAPLVGDEGTAVDVTVEE